MYQFTFLLEIAPYSISYFPDDRRDQGYMFDFRFLCKLFRVLESGTRPYKNDIGLGRCIPFAKVFFACYPVFVTKR